MAANNAQVQRFVDERIRPHAELIRQAKLTYDDDIASIGDVYANLVAQSPTWADGRGDNPPNLLTVADVLAINAFMHDIRDAIINHSSYPVVLKACVRQVGG